MSGQHSELSHLRRAMARGTWDNSSGSEVDL